MSDRLLFWGVLLAVLTGAHYCLFVRFLEIMDDGWATRLWLFVGLCAMLSSFSAGRLGILIKVTPNVTLQSVFNRFGSTWNIFIFLTTVFILFIEAVERVFSPIAPEYAFATAALASFALCVYGLMEARTIVTLKLALHTQSLPKGRSRLRIVQLSDLHIGPFMSVSHIARVVSAAYNTFPDLVVITGDIIDGDVGSRRDRLFFYHAFSSVLAQLHAFSPEFGVWAVPGNHDYYEDAEAAQAFMKKSGINLLRTEKTDLGDIVIVGADDLDHVIHIGGKNSKSRSEALLSSLTAAERDKFVLLLRHRPVVEPSTIGRFNLQLSGHTHGGQLFTIPSSNHRLPGKSRGMLHLGRGKTGRDSWLYVSNGAGFVGPPMRFLSPAEIVVIDLLETQGE